jgi:hypothetical protein
MRQTLTTLQELYMKTKQPTGKAIWGAVIVVALVAMGCSSKMFASQSVAPIETQTAELERGITEQGVQITELGAKVSASEEHDAAASTEAEDEAIAADNTTDTDADEAMVAADNAPDTDTEAASVADNTSDTDADEAMIAADNAPDTDTEAASVADNTSDTEEASATDNTGDAAAEAASAAADSSDMDSEPIRPETGNP